MEAMIVEAAQLPPGKCIATGDIDGPFIDTGSWANVVGNTRIYLHVPLVKFYARHLLEMVDGEEVEWLREQVTAMGEEIERLKRIVAAEEELSAALQEVAA